MIVPNVSSKDHPYSVQSSPKALKKRLLLAEAKVAVLRSKLRNSRKREKRAKMSMQELIANLKQQQLLTTECEQRLETFKGIYIFIEVL